MQITVSGKQVDLSDALRERVSHELTGITGKYFGHAQDARVTFARSRLGFACDINLHAGHGLTLRGEAESTNAYTAFDKAAVHVGKQLRRYRRRVNEHARDEAQRERPEAAGQLILHAEAEDHEETEDSTPAALS
jgi:ribosomal subunit interface protein